MTCWCVEEGMLFHLIKSLGPWHLGFLCLPGGYSSVGYFRESGDLYPQKIRKVLFLCYTILFYQQFPSFLGVSVQKERNEPNFVLNVSVRPDWQTTVDPTLEDDSFVKTYEISQLILLWVIGGETLQLRGRVSPSQSQVGHRQMLQNLPGSQIRTWAWSSE